jgi:TolA-binding protein
MKKFIIFFFIIFLNADPSAFEAGDLDSNNPYGLTKDEQYIWKNKQDIKQLQKLVESQQKIIKAQQKSLSTLKLQFLNYKMKVDTISQQLDGIKTVLPDLDTMNNELASLKQDLNATNVILFKLKDDVDNNKKLNEKNINTIVGLIEKLAKRIDKIQNTKTEVDFRLWSKSKIFTKAVDYYHKSKLAKAKEMFLYLYNQKYKLGQTAFYLGEINYKFAYYKNALAYYKKSIQNTKDMKIYYMDDLLYHTGYSLEKIGNKEAAKKSYLKLIHDFPKSIFVKFAKKRLKNL